MIGVVLDMIRVVCVSECGLRMVVVGWLWSI